MKYLVHYFVEGFGGQKEYFEDLDSATKFADQLSVYAEDVEIINL